MRWLELTWTEVRELDRERTVPILPVGATEAHGPHLPLGTDGYIAEAMASASLPLLAERGWQGVILPPVDFTAARFAEGFPGTLSPRRETVTALLQDLLASLAQQGFRVVAVANAHLDPEHLLSLRAAFENAPLAIAFPDLTRRRLAERLTDEFRAGACHAGQYEGSLLLACRADLVRPLAHSLPDNPVSLLPAIKAGTWNFEAAGGPEAYFGSPRNATLEEGRASLEVLAHLLLEAVEEKLSPSRNPQP